VDEGRTAFKALGKSDWGFSKSENESRRLRRTLYIVKDVKKGELITSENLRAIRPGDGCLPKYILELLGKKFCDDFSEGTPMDIKYAKDN
jgi:N-acetylneuraminate synthase